MDEIQEIKPRHDLTVDVTWTDGRHARVDFRPIIDRSPIFDALRDSDFFVGRAQIAHRGGAIAWSDILEFSADGLRYDAFPEDYRRDFGDAAAE